MMPLTVGEIGKEYEIIKVGGRGETLRHLENLGFVPGGKVTMISNYNGSTIVNVKNVRVGLSEALARKIMV